MKMWNVIFFCKGDAKYCINITEVKTKNLAIARATMHFIAAFPDGYLHMIDRISAESFI